MTHNREIFPGAQLPQVVGGTQTMEDKELLTRLRRAVKLYKDEGVRARDPYAYKSLGHHILSYIKELKRRGFTIVEHGETFIVHAPNTVELVKGDRVEIVDEQQMKARVYWRVSDAVHIAEKKGHKRRRAELTGALLWLVREWHIVEISRQNRTVKFNNTNTKEVHGSDQQNEST